MRNHINLFETIANDHGTNQRIEDELAGASPKDHAEILDGLESVMNAGAEGITSREWIRTMQSLNADWNAERLASLMRMILKSFSFCVVKQGDKYVWKEHAVDDTQDDDMDPMLHAAASTQIAITHRMIELMREMGSFTERDILPHIATMGLPPQMARIFFDHVVQGMLGKSVTKVGDTYHYSEEKPLTVADHMRSFRNMLDTPGVE